MKIYFITYGDQQFYLSKKNLSYLAKNSGLFDNVISLGPSDLDKQFKSQYQKILKVKKGGGYWIWKHRIIKNLLDEIKENDLIVYCDAGASLNTSKKAVKRFYDYIDILADVNTSQLRMRCESHFLEKNYTHRRLFDYFNIKLDSQIADSTQLQAGHQFYKKNQESLDYFQEYSKVLEEDVNLITDVYSEERQINTFVEHRHDQSIFSLMSKKYDSKIIDNETEFRIKPELQFDYPFLSVRSYGHRQKDYLKYMLTRKRFLSKTIYFPLNKN